MGLFSKLAAGLSRTRDTFTGGIKSIFHGHVDDSLEKTLMLGGIGGRRRRGQPRMRWLDGIT